MLISGTLADNSTVRVTAKKGQFEFSVTNNPGSTPTKKANNGPQKETYRGKGPIVSSAEDEDDEDMED